MHQKIDHVEKLSTARERVIAECRKLAALSSPHERHRFVAADEGFIAVQNTIDQIRCKFAGNTDPLRGIFASNSDPF